MHRILFIVLLCPLLVLGQPAETASHHAAVPRFGRVLVIANSRSAASCELASRYAWARQLPAANILRIPIDENISISGPAFRDSILKPVSRRLEELGDAVDFLAIMRDVPYRVGQNSITAALGFGGLQSIPPVHGYFGREDYFEHAVPYYGARFHPATVVSGFTVDDGADMIRRSQMVYGNRKETGTFYFCEGAGPRGSRNRQIEPAMMLLRRLGYRAEHVKAPSLSGRKDVLAQFTGATRLAVSGNTYLPGSIIDNMTSFGGYLLEQNSQMSALAFIQHGATGSYGTVVEPTNNPTRWANYTLAAKYARGFNLVESYYQTLQDTSLGVIVGDPLAAPFSVPCNAQVTIPAETISEGTPARLNIKVSEGGENEGVAWVQVWLNDMVKVFEWTPELAAGTHYSLVVQDADGDIYKDSRTLETATKLQDALREFQVQQQVGSRGKLSISLTGKHSNRLLVRWNPTTADPKPVHCTFSITTATQTYQRDIPLYYMPIMATVAVLDFGSAEPAFGDQVVVKVNGERRVVRAVRGETLESLMKRLADYMHRLPEFGDGSEWLIQLVQSDDQPARRVMRILPRQVGQKRQLALELEVNRAEGSPFAPLLDSPEALWHYTPLGLLGEGVITPFVPTARLQQTFEIPPEILYEGPQRVLCVAGDARGNVTHAGAAFNVEPAGEKAPATAAIMHDVADLGDTVTMVLTPNESTRDLYPTLILDGRPLANWRKGSRLASFKLKLPAVSPGEHEICIEWGESPELPADRELRSPKARSQYHKLWIRRPLDAGLTWSPRQIEAGEPATLTLQGPFLREGLSLVLRPHMLEITRDPNDGMLFHVTLPALTAGTYELSLMGDARREKLSNLPGTLEVK